MNAVVSVAAKNRLLVRSSSSASTSAQVAAAPDWPEASAGVNRLLACLDTQRQQQQHGAPESDSALPCTHSFMHQLVATACSCPRSSRAALSFAALQVGACLLVSGSQQQLQCRLAPLARGQRWGSLQSSHKLCRNLNELPARSRLPIDSLLLACARQAQVSCTTVRPAQLAEAERTCVLPGLCGSRARVGMGL